MEEQEQRALAAPVEEMGHEAEQEVPEGREGLEALLLPLAQPRLLLRLAPRNCL